MQLSSAHGPSGLPLVDETIGAHLARVVERVPDRHALVVRQSPRRPSSAFSP